MRHPFSTRCLSCCAQITTIGLRVAKGIVEIVVRNESCLCNYVVQMTYRIWNEVQIGVPCNFMLSPLSFVREQLSSDDYFHRKAKPSNFFSLNLSSSRIILPDDRSNTDKYDSVLLSLFVGALLSISIVLMAAIH